MKPYWWNEVENSSPARAMVLADRLYCMLEAALSAEAADAACEFSISANEAAAEDPSNDQNREGDTFIDNSLISAEYSNEIHDSESSMNMKHLTELFKARNKSIISSESVSVHASDGHLPIESMREESEIIEILTTDSCEKDACLTSTFVISKGAEPEYTNWTETFRGYVLMSQWIWQV